MGSRVREFLGRECSVDPQRLDLDTGLDALGVDGADGWELIESFGKELEVDLSGFAAAKHFGPEASANLFFPFSALIRATLEGLGILRKQEPNEARGLTPITVRDLIEAAESKKWRL